MRFADMMNQIKQNIAWPNERAHDDAVLQLVPKFDSTYRFPEIIDKAVTPSQVDGKSMLSYINAEQPAPRAFYPAWVSFDSFKLKHAHSSRRGGAWPVEVPQVLQDFLKIDNERMLISSFAREVFDVHCPGALEYIEVEVRAPKDVIRAPFYYFINVLAQAQMIDWSLINSDALGQIRRTTITWNNSKLHKAVPFKSYSEIDSLLWHERHLDGEHRAAPGNIYVRGKLWNILVEYFDQQFQSQTQLSLEE
jgi:hypothetical protein